MSVEKESTYKVMNSNQKIALVIKVDDQGYATVEDYQGDTKASEFCRLLRGLANAIEGDYPDLTQANAALINLKLPRFEPACPNHEPIL